MWAFFERLLDSQRCPRMHLLLWEPELIWLQCCRIGNRPVLFSISVALSIFVSNGATGLRFHL